MMFETIESEPLLIAEKNHDLCSGKLSQCFRVDGQVNSMANLFNEWYRARLSSEVGTLNIVSRTIQLSAQLLRRLGRKKPSNTTIKILYATIQRSGTS